MSPTSQNKVAQAAPVAPYLGIQTRLSKIFKTVAPIKFQALIISRPDMMSILDSKKFTKNRRIAQERTSNTGIEGRNFSPYTKLMIAFEKVLDNGF